jgi:hypothetical protein
MKRKLRTGIVLGALVFSGVACGTDSKGDGGGTGGGQCQVVIEFNGRDYVQADSDGSERPGAKLGHGGWVSCADSDDADGPSGGESLDVSAVKGRGDNVELIYVESVGVMKLDDEED